MATDNYSDLANRHSVYIERLATQQLNELAYPQLARSYRAARRIVLDAEEITSRSQINKLALSMMEAIEPTSTAMWDKLTINLQDTASYEVGFYAKMFGTVNAIAMIVPGDEKVLASINSKPLKLEESGQFVSKKWRTRTRENTRANVNIFKQNMIAGLGDGESTQQIVNRFKTSTNGVLKNWTESITRSGMQHYTVQARESLMDSNKEQVKRKFYNTVFDNRRTIICSHYAADPVFLVTDTSAPVPPVHYNCRSNWLYLLDGQDVPDGTRAAVGGKKGEEAEAKFNKRENALNKRRANENIDGKTSSKVRYRGRKDSDVFKAGQISTSIGADEFMRNQPIWFQDSALGKGRAKLFRGGASLKDFASMTGRPLTLKELKASGV